MGRTRALLAQAKRPETAHEWEQAVALLTRALEAADEEVALAREILDRRAECRRLQGDLPGAVADLEALARLAADQGDGTGQGEADLRRRAAHHEEPGGGPPGRRLHLGVDAGVYASACFSM